MTDGAAVAGASADLTIQEPAALDARLPVSVVIPVHDAAAFLGDTLRSVACQQPAVEEVIIVDDASADGSVEIARGFAAARVVPNRGRGVDAARRLGIELSTAPYVALLDHDDVWHPEHLRELQRVLKARPDAAAALCEPVHFQDGRTPSFPEHGAGLTEVDPWEHFPDSFTTTPSSVLIRRDALQAVGGWTPGNFEGCGELYMWLRLSEWGPILMNGRQTAAYRVREDSVSMRLRRDGRAHYANQIAAAAEAAARASADTTLGGGAELEKRLLVAAAVRHLGAGIFGNSARELARGAALLAEGTRGQPIQRVEAVMRLLFWLIDGDPGARTVDSDAYRPLIAYWPARARRVGRYRLRFTALRPLLRSALRRPFDGWRWRWLAEAAFLRLAGRT